MVDREGNILLRSEGKLGEVLYTNIFDIINGSADSQDDNNNGSRVDQADVDRFKNSLNNGESGSLTLKGRTGTFVIA